jgi:uncharacterized protein YidB (DUF937 family)
LEKIMSLLDLVGSVLGGGQQQQQSSPQAAVMQAVLGMLTRGHAQQGGGGALGALAGLMGGGGQQAGGAAGVLGALGGLMGGGQAQQAQNPLGALGALGGLLGGGGQQAQEQGGGLAMTLPQLIGLFQNSGAGNAASSWLSSGDNHAVSGEQVASAFGGDRLAALASQLGMSQEETSGHLADILPQVVDKLSPNGAMPQDNEVGDMLGNVLGSLMKR